MRDSISIREYVKNYTEGKYDSPDVETQIEAGWYDWFCKDSSLKRKTEVLTQKLLQIISSSKINLDTMYCFFKNNYPLYGTLYDDFRICDRETGFVLYTVIPKSGYTKNKGASEVWGKENCFKEPLVKGSWKDVISFFLK